GIRDRNVTGVQTCALPIFCFTWNSTRLWSLLEYLIAFEMILSSTWLILSMPISENIGVSGMFLINSTSSLCVISKRSIILFRNKIGRASCRGRRWVSEVGV